MKEAHTETLWFCLVAIMIAGYAVLDGFDLGAGIVHLFVARSDAERRSVLASVGPVWDGNEVWLVAGGGVLFFAFPPVYASGFQGFYLPLIIVLWLLILRGIAIEFRNKVSSLVWSPFWDVVFAGASAMLAIFFGAAIGNVVRGVPLDRSGFFFLPLWANLRLMPAAGILDWFTIIVALGSLAALTVHGALWVAMKTAGAVAARARNAADQQSGACARGHAAASADDGSGKRTDGSADHGAFHCAVRLRLLRRCAADLTAGELPAVHVVGAELVEALAGARHHHHAGAAVHAHAGAQQQRRTSD